jgi:hypothetical protein
MSQVWRLPVRTDLRQLTRDMGGGMNRGGLGHMSESGRLVLPPELLEHLGVSSDGMLFGIYYPSSHSKSPDHETKLRHAFVFTPIPDRFWNRCARLIVQLQHAPASLARVAKFLKQRNVSIFSAEATRAGYRYAIWSLHIVFEGNAQSAFDPGEFDETSSVYTNTFKELTAISDDLRRTCTDVLFVDDSELDLRNPVVALPCTALAFFHHQVEVHTSQVLTGDGDWLYAPFEVKCGDGGVLFTDDSRFASIVKKVTNSGPGAICPSPVLLSLDTRYLNIRVALPSEEQLQQLFEIEVDYERLGKPDTCVGILAALTNRLGPDHNLWWLYNYTRRSGETGETGTVAMLSEHRPSTFGRTVTQTAAHIRERILSTREGLTVHTRFVKCRVKPVLAGRVRERLRAQVSARPGYQVFLSYAEEDESFAKIIVEKLSRQGVDVYFAPKAERGGNFSNDIKKALLHADELCLICTHTSMKSIWVGTEWGAAWVLGTLIVPITVKMSFRNLPARLQEWRGRTWAEYEDYVNDVLDRKRSKVFSLTEYKPDAEDDSTSPQGHATRL